MERYSCLVGSYASPSEESIFRYDLDFSQNSMGKIWGVTGLLNPSYLCVDPKRRLLYAVEESAPSGNLCVLRLEQAGARLLLRTTTLEAHPCHVALDPAGEFLSVANYCDARPGGSVVLYRLDKAGMPSLCGITYHRGSGPNPIRQQTPHPHSTCFLDGLVLACDLGTDHVCCYRLDRRNGALEETSASFEMPAGSGPRHLFVPRGGKFLYVACEMDGMVCVLRRERDCFSLCQRIDSLSAGTPADARAKNRTAAIKATEDERYLFVTNRGDDSVAAFAIGEDHLLRLLDIQKTGSTEPRELTLFGDHMLIGHQEGRCITGLTFCRKTGTLGKPSLRLDLPVQPVCIAPL